MTAERILVIEDEPGARTALSRLLTDEGYTVCTAGTGSAGLERLADFHPDTVVCDFYLPDIDGLSVLRSARAASSEGIVFILLTGACGGAEAESTLREEADFFFLKPVDLPELRGALRQSYSRRGRRAGEQAGEALHLPSAGR